MSSSPVIIDAVRTPIGTEHGSLKNVTVDQLVTPLIAELAVDAHQQQQVGAVLGAALPGVDGDEAIAAGTVLDDHACAPGARELVSHQTGHAVGAAAHREGADDAHLLGGELLRSGELRRQSGGCGSHAQRQRQRAAKTERGRHREGHGIQTTNKSY